ncbi:MAG: xanthine dehydrogenase molybdopterin binding subunit [Alphaproteobacteria bacterium]|nr:MAG: xanthine dehydrogenase molybdopterin binding subunit [Alphaproteobacteria bacterium]
MSLQLDRRSEELRLRVVRRPLRHDSAAKHVAGSATFVDDIREPEGLLHIAAGGVPAASGQLLGVDLAAVRAAPGVVAVLTAADIPGKNDVGPVVHDDPVFVESRIEFYGQVVFAVVATTREQARRAAKLAKVAAAVGTHCVSVDDALAAGSHILPDCTFRKDDSAAALAASAHRVKGQLRIGGQEHFYLEGQVSLAIPGEDGDMLIHTSTQHPSEMQHLIAGMLKVPVSAVTVEVRRMGGAFGGKETQAAQWAALAALAAQITGRPCKIRLDRDDDMCLTGKRHDFLSDYEVGFDAEGRIQALETVMASRCGYSADLSGAINDRAMFHADNAYFLPAATITTKRMKTNTVSNTAFRGFGGPQGMMVAERAIDEIAWALKLDPLDVRKRNLYGEGRDITPYGMLVEDNILPALLDRCEVTSDYRARRRKIAAFNAQNGALKRGMALNPVKFGISFTTTHLNQAGALVHVYQDGSIHLNHGGTEMGQGIYIKVAQVVAEEFGVDADRVKILATSTAKVPNTSATAASSGSDINGWAAKNAAGAIKERLINFAAGAYDVVPSQIEFRDNRVFIGNQSVPFAELIRKAYLARVSLSSTGFYKTPKIHWDPATGKGRPFFYFAYGAACSEVLVDVTTGEMKVQRVDILHDVGRSLNPAVDIGQIEGGFVQGMGWLTTEELVFHADGRLLTHAPSTYKIPCASDVPEHFNIALWDGANREDTIYRSKAVGEPPLMLAISVFAAIADAIHSLNPDKAVPLDAPATPESILRAVQAVTS